MKPDELLNQFDDGLRKLTVEYDIFFCGGRKIPPTNLRFRVDQIVKQLLEERMNLAQRFRYNQLVAKFSVYKDLWRRQMQEKEEKGSLRSESELKELITPPTENENESKDYYSQSLTDPDKQVAQVLRLYQELQCMRLKNGETKLHVDIDQFRKLITEKMGIIKGKKQCDSAEFIICIDQASHKVKFMARPLPKKPVLPPSA